MSKPIVVGKVSEGFTGELWSIIRDQRVWNTISCELGLAKFDDDFTLRISELFYFSVARIVVY